MKKELKIKVNEELLAFLNWWDEEEDPEEKKVKKLFNHFSTEYFYENELLNIQDFFTQYLQNVCYSYYSDIIYIMVNKWNLPATDKNGKTWNIEKSVKLFGYYMFVCFKDLLKKNQIDIFNVINRYEAAHHLGTRILNPYMVEA